MAIDRTQSQLVGILVPLHHGPGDLWAAQSSYSEAGTRPGVPETASRPKLQLQTSGEQTSTTYEITTRRGGHIRPGGAGYTWLKSGDAATLERGFDPPNTLHHWQAIAWDGLSAIDLASDPHAVRLPSGKVLVAYYFVSSILYGVRVTRRAGSGTAVSTVVYTQTTVVSSRITSTLQPSMAVLEDGSVILAHLVEDTSAQLAQVRVWRSTDEGDTWEIHSTFALDESISTHTSTGFTVRRLRLAHKNGHTALILWMTANTTSYTARHAYRQYGSTADGTRFELVEAMDDSGDDGVIGVTLFGWFDLIAMDGGFLVAYPASPDSLNIRYLATSFTPLSMGENSLVSENVEAMYTLDGTSKYVVDGEAALWVDEAGALFFSWRNTSNAKCGIIASLDGGATWTGLGIGLSSSDLSWWVPPATTVYPERFCGVGAHGRSYVFGEHEAPTTTTHETSISEYALGGYTTVCMPGTTAFGDSTARAPWAKTWVPLEIPSNCGFTSSSAGSPTISIASAYLSISCGASDRVAYQLTPSGTTAQGLIVEAHVRLESGGSLTMYELGFRGLIEEAGVGYGFQVRLRHSPAAIGLYDAAGGAVVGAAITSGIDWANTYEIRVEMRGEDVQLWYRVRDLSSDRAWTEGPTGTLTDSGGGGTSVVGFGHAATGVAVSRWYLLAYSSEEETGTRDLPAVNPDDLHARDYAGVDGATYLDGGLLISALQGPGREGDLYEIAPDADYPIDRVFWSEAPSPRHAWRSSGSSASTQIAEQRIALALDPGILSGAESEPLSQVFGVHLAGINWRSGKLQRYDVGSAGWVDVVAIDTAISLAYTRRGSTLVPSSNATSGRFFRLDELEGWWVKLDSSAPPTFRRVRRNSSGLSVAGASAPAVVLELEGMAGSEPSSGTALLYPPDITVLAFLDGERAAGWRLVIDAQYTPTGYAQIGCYWPGEVVILGQPHEDNERTTTVSGTLRADSDDYLSAAIERAPARREGELAWTAPMSVGPLEGAAAAPDYVAIAGALGARAVATYGSVSADLDGIFRRIQGARRPVVLLPNIATDLSTAVITERHLHTRAYLLGPIEQRRVLGREGASSGGAILRVEAIPYEEVV